MTSVSPAGASARLTSDAKLAAISGECTARFTAIQYATSADLPPTRNAPATTFAGKGLAIGQQKQENDGDYGDGG